MSLIILFRRCNDNKFRLYLLILSILLSLMLIILSISSLQKLVEIYKAETNPSPFLSSKYNTLPSKIRGVAPPIEIFDFPTPKERIQFYMGDWYYNNNNNNNSNNNENSTTNNNYNNTDICSSIKYWEPSLPSIGHPYIFDETNLFQLIYEDSLKRLRLPWRPKRSYGGDAYLYHFQSVKNEEEEVIETETEKANINDSNSNINNNKENKQNMLLQFGDGKDSANFLSTPFPIMVKTRLSQRVYEERYDRKNFTNNNNSPPILGMYMIYRHYSDHFYETDEIWDTTAWNNKKSTLIWRGSSSGQRRKVIEQYIDYDDAVPHHRQQDIDINIYIDVAFSEILKVHQNKFKHHPDEYYVRDSLSVSQLLEYKYLLVLEGWGISTSLKWMLYSNSLVFMAQSTKVSWAMEEKLIPWVHYIPLYDNYTNLPEQLEWARSHDEESYQIVLYSRQYIERLVTSKQAQKETIEILHGIDQIYQKKYGPILQLCPRI